MCTRPHAQAWHALVAAMDARAAAVGTDPSWPLPQALPDLLSPQAQLEAQKATQDFQRATEVLRAAKETISLAEQRLLEDDKRQFDSAWQEMLNHATQRVGVAVCAVAGTQAYPTRGETGVWVA